MKLVTLRKIVPKMKQLLLLLQQNKKGFLNVTNFNWFFYCAIEKLFECEGSF